MVSAVRRGHGIRTVARQFRVSPATVAFWGQRAGAQRLDRVDFGDRSSRPQHSPHQTPAAMEELVLRTRQELRERSVLGEYGAAAIRRSLVEAGQAPVPAVRTINRILERHGVFDHRQRVRRRPPPPGWYLPTVGARHAELDSLDVVEGLKIQAGPEVVVLTGISLHGGLVTAWPTTSVTARFTTEALIAHWQAVGLPAFAQFDNDTRFQGPHQHADVLGRVMRLCLSLDVIPVFAPPRESGFQAAIESVGGRWQATLWARFHHASLAAVQAQSAAYIAACRRRAAVRIEGAPARRPFPQPWQLSLQARPRGQVIFLRRTSETGTVDVLGHRFRVAPTWLHRLVRAEVDLDREEVRFVALRRRDPADQPLLATEPYHFPNRRFRE